MSTLNPNEHVGLMHVWRATADTRTPPESDHSSKNNRLPKKGKSRKFEQNPDFFRASERGREDSRTDVIFFLPAPI